MRGSEDEKDALAMTLIGKTADFWTAILKEHPELTYQDIIGATVTALVASGGVSQNVLGSDLVDFGKEMIKQGTAEG